MNHTARRELPLASYLAELYQRMKKLDDGSVATYIPSLADADPGWCGISLMTVDGHRYEVGDTAQPFTIQSISKPFAFGMALEDRGVEGVAGHVGVEPTGDPFNSITLDENSRRPFNPMVNAGAIVTSTLVAGADRSAQFDRVLNSLGCFAGRRLTVDESVFASERSTGDRNRAIAYLMRTFDMLAADVDDALDLYFRQCSILVDCSDLAAMAATLANRGVNPLTGERALAAEHVPRVLSVMATCGMYDFAGEWVYRVGVPAKSGVSGGVLAVLPGQLGIAVFSPPLDEVGNSVRGVAVCEELSGWFHLHLLDPHTSVTTVVRACFRGDTVRSKRVRGARATALLEEAGARTCVVQLQGDLYFGSAEALTRRVLDELELTDFMILDWRRTGIVDAGARDLLARLAAVVHAANVVLVVTERLPEDLPGELLASGARTFPDLDGALQWCEDELLRMYGESEDEDAVCDLADLELLQGITGSSLAAFESELERHSFAAGQVVFREGDTADRIFFLLSGRVSVLLHMGGRKKRLATLGPGMAFGDLAVLDGGQRSSAIEVDEDAQCLTLSVEALARLSLEVPGAVSTFYANLARSCARRLRDANHEVRALEG